MAAAVGRSCRPPADAHGRRAAAAAHYLAEMSSAPALGIDIGGTKVALALVDAGGALLARTRVPTDPALGGRGTIDVAREAAAVAFGARLGDACAVGVCVAGQVLPDGILAGAPNLGWSNEPLGALAGAAFGRPVAVANDVHAAAWAEWRFGAGKGSREFVAVFAGTGVGGGIVSGGRLLTGASGSCGEIGHLTLVAGGRRCHCGNLGCFEAYASGWAMQARAVELAAEPGAGGPIAEALRARGSAAVTAEVIAAARAARDPLAVRVADEARFHLGAAAVGLVNIFNPERLVLGGGILVGFPDFVEAAEDAIRSRSLRSAAATCSVMRAGLPADAPVVGAADLARTLVEQPQ